ncbi:hypothetical protein [Pontibacter sp. HSC-14F20]
MQLRFWKKKTTEKPVRKSALREWGNALMFDRRRIHFFSVGNV